MGRMELRVPATLRTPALLAALLLAAGCGRAVRTSPPAEAKPAVRAVFFGSSTVAGTGATRPERTWTARLAQELRWTELNLGLPGSRLTQRPARIPSGEQRWPEVVAARPDVVVLMYGANDVDGNVPLGEPGTPGTFRHAAAQVLGQLHRALPRTVLVVCSPQPARALEEKRGPYDQALAEAAAAVGALYVPGDQAFPSARLDALARDRLHLNDAGHAELARFVAARLHAANVAAQGGRSPR
ncbi:MAG: SGNH/GDSL hydrolase family protein [Anaeromyxobacter sp.]